MKPKGERRQDILEAALELFVENGFEDTTVQQIADRAGVAAGTVYLYFGSKRDVLLGLHEEFHQGMEERFLETTGDFFARREDGQDLDYTQAIDEALDSMVAYSLEHRTVCEVIARHLSQAGLTDEAMLAERRFADFLARCSRPASKRGSSRSPIHRWPRTCSAPPSASPSDGRSPMAIPRTSTGWSPRPRSCTTRRSLRIRADPS